MRLVFRRRDGQFGFSLVELMVVLVLIGIMTAAILPEMRGTYEDALLRATSRRLVDVCHLAYSRAVSLNQTHRVHFDRSNGRYFIEKAEEHLGFARARDIWGGEGVLDSRISMEIRRQGEAPPAAMDPGSSAPPEEEIEVRTSDQGIAFYSDGTADGGEIVLRDRDGFRLALRINPVTARVRIVELERQ